MVQTVDEVLKIALAEPLSGRLPAEAQAEPRHRRRHDNGLDLLEISEFRFQSSDCTSLEHPAFESEV